MAEMNQFTLREAGGYDKQKGLADKLTGWGRICKLRANENSKSQKRKRNRSNNRWQKS